MRIKLWQRKCQKREEIEGKEWNYSFVQTATRNFCERKVYKKKKVYVTKQGKIITELHRFSFSFPFLLLTLETT